MHQITQLRQTLQPLLGWHGARVTFLSLFLVALFRVLEATHLKDPERLKKLIALLTLAFCWAHRVGEWVVEQHPIKIKKHGRKARSIFRTGFDSLRTLLLNLDEKMDEFLDVLRFLSCT